MSQLGKNSHTEADAVTRDGLSTPSAMPRVVGAKPSRREVSDVAGGGGGTRKQTNRMVSNGRSITGCLIHRVTTYNGFQDAYLIFSLPVLPFRKKLSSFK